MTQAGGEKLEILFNDHIYFLTVNIAAPVDLLLNLFGLAVIALNASSEMGIYKWYLFNLQVDQEHYCYRGLLSSGVRRLTRR